MLFAECAPLLGGWVRTPDKGYSVTNCNGYLLAVNTMKLLPVLFNV